MTENGTRPTGIARIDGKYITAKPRLLEFQLAVSVLVNSLKGVSSQMIRKKNYPCIRKKMWGGHGGLHPILPPHAEERRLPSFANTSSNSKRLRKLTTWIPAVSALFILSLTGRISAQSVNHDLNYVDYLQ